MPPRQLQQEIRKERRQVNASVVDSFTAPKARRANATRLATALDELGSIAGSRAEDERRRADQADLKAGHEFALKLEKEGRQWRDAIADGSITADQSPFFKLGAEEQSGRLAANRFNAALLNEIRVNPQLRESTDPEDFERFIVGFRSDFEAQEDGGKFFNQGFAPAAAAHIANARGAFASVTGGRLIENTKEATYRETVEGLRLDQLAGRSPLETINAIKERQFAIGLTGDELGRQIADAVIDTAEETDDLNLLNVLDKVVTGKGQLGGKPDINRDMEAARDRIVSKRMTARSRAWQEIAHERSENTRATRRQLFNDLRAGDPDALEKAIAADLENGIDNSAQVLTSFQRSWENATFATDPRRVELLTIQINTPNDKTHPDYIDFDDLNGLMRQQLINQDDYTYLEAAIDRRNRRIEAASASSGGHPYRDPVFTMGVSNLLRQFQNETGAFSGASRRDASNAVSEFGREWLAFLSSDAESASDPSAQAEFLRSTRERLVTTRRNPILDMTDQFSVSPDEVPELTFPQMERMKEELNRGATNLDFSFDDLSQEAYGYIALYNIQTFEDFKAWVAEQDSLHQKLPTRAQRR